VETNLEKVLNDCLPFSYMRLYNIFSNNFVALNNLHSAILNRSSPPFSSCDWRFNEFSNPSSHALYVTCVELMALPMSGEAVGKAIIDVICKG